MSGRKTDTAKERLARQRDRCEWGERILKRGTAWHDLDADELRAVKAAHIRRIMNMRSKVKHLEPRSPKRKPVEEEIALLNQLLDYSIQPALAKALHEEVIEILEEYRDKV